MDRARCHAPATSARRHYWLCLGEAFPLGSAVSLEDMMNNRHTATILAFSAALAIGGATLARAEDVTTTRTVDRPAGDVTTTRNVDRPGVDRPVVGRPV